MIDDETRQLQQQYKQQWVEEYGNVSSEGLEKFWLEAFATYQEMLRNSALLNRARDMADSIGISHKTSVLSAPLGSGKSTTLQMYLKQLPSWAKVVVVVELIETADNYAREIGEKATAIHSQNSIDFDTCDSQVIIITHQKLKRMIHTNRADEVFERFDLVVIDEQVDFFRSSSLNIEFIQMGLLNLLTNLNMSQKYIDVFTRVVEDLKALDDNGIHINTVEFNDWEGLLSEFEMKLATIIGRKDKWLTDQISTVVDVLRGFVSAFKYHGRLVASYYYKNGASLSFNVVADYLSVHSKIVLDGTAEIDSIYNLLSRVEDSNFEVKSYHSIRDYSNVKMYLTKMSTGRKSLTKQDEKIYQLVEDVTAKVSDTDKVLYICHRDNDKVFKRAIAELDNQAVIYWGGSTVGSNKYRDYNKVVVYGLNHLPHNEYASRHISTIDTEKDIETITPEEIRDMEISMLSASLLQGINRSLLRVATDANGKAPDGIEVYIGLPNNKTIYDGIVKHIKHLMKGINIVEDNIENPLYKINKKEVSPKFQLLMDYLEVYDGDVIPFNDVDVMSRQSHRILTNDKGGAFSQLLYEYGWELRTVGKQFKKKHSLHHAVRRAYIRVLGLDDFTDETVGTDINGNEF